MSLDSVALLLLPFLRQSALLAKALRLNLTGSAATGAASPSKADAKKSSASYMDTSDFDDEDDVGLGTSAAPTESRAFSAAV